MTRFREVQRLQPTRTRWLVGFPPALVTAIAVAQRVHGAPFGAHALSNPELASLAILLWLVYVWLARVRLVTEVGEDAVSVRLRGLFQHHRLPLAAVVSAEPVACSPERDFGGYGFRAVKGGRAYVARASGGVRLELEGGRFAVIGSARPDDLAAAIRAQRASVARKEAQ